MKKVLTLLILMTYLFNHSFAQKETEPRNSVKFGLGTTFLKPGDYFGQNSMHLQYEHRLFKPIRFAVDGFRINAEQVNRNDGHEKSTEAYQVDAGLNIALFSNATNALKIGGAGSWQDYTYRYTTAIERDSNDQIINKVFDERKNKVFGWAATIEYEVYVVKYLVIGSRLTYKRYENGDQNYFFGLNAGFRF